MIGPYKTRMWFSLDNFEQSIFDKIDIEVYFIDKSLILLINISIKFNLTSIFVL